MRDYSLVNNHGNVFPDKGYAEIALICQKITASGYGVICHKRTHKT